VDPEKVVQINSFEGSPTDGKSKVWPVKIFRGKQPYDKVSMSLLIPHTAGEDNAAYWKVFDWKKALTAGMQAVDDKFSGEYGFVSTEMSWPITHMVAPKEDALKCTQCHSPYGRLQKVSGLYMPGRDSNKVLNVLGWTVALLALIGVLIHGALRIRAARKGS